jgi:hypothetical protein
VCFFISRGLNSEDLWGAVYCIIKAINMAWKPVFIAAINRSHDSTQYLGLVIAATSFFKTLFENFLQKI